MPNYLMILEVAKKQDYIFEPRRLRENIRRSEAIFHVTDQRFFNRYCAEFYNDDNLVYSGGGHTVLQFEQEQQALAFSDKLTRQALRFYPEMELYVKLMQYDPAQTPAENLRRLSLALEAKKARRLAFFHRRSFGIDFNETPEIAPEPPTWDAERRFGNWELTTDGEKLAGKDSFLAVVHIDGNSMGARVGEIYQSAGAEDWESCRAALRGFSDAVTDHFEMAFREMEAELADRLPSLGWDPETDAFPVRKIILAGDDVTFVTAGSLGIECAASVLRHLEGKTNPTDGKGYTACAGVCMVHTKYPFRPAYDLSEELCRNAKKFSAQLDPSGNVSAIDWHIELGQLKDGLRDIRSEYRSDDGAELNLRPLNVSGTAASVERSFDFFRTLVRKLKNEEMANKLPRSKVLAAFDAMKQGETETALVLRRENLENLLRIGVEDRDPDWIRHAFESGEIVKEAFFTDFEGMRRCLYFDAIEMMDRISLWEEKP